MAGRLRLGILGCGKVVERFHLPALRSSARWRVTRIWDASEARSAWAADRIRGVEVFSTVESLLDPSAIDAVLVASPPSLHREHAFHALSAGIPVLVEKPCGLSAEEARSLSEGAAAGNVPLRVGYNRRFHPSYVRLRRSLEDSSASVEWEFESRMSFTVSAWGAYSGYLGRREAGGGVLLDVASHQLDLLAWLGGTHVASVEPLSYHRHSDVSEEIQYRCVLATGTTAECLARHGVVYFEAMTARSKRGTILSHATGVVRTRDENPDGLWRSAERRAWIDRKWMRLGLMRDPLTISFRHQWEAFADVVTRREDTAPLADATDAAAIHEHLANLDEFVRSRPSLPSRRPRSLKARPAGDERAESSTQVAASVVMVVGNQRRRAAAALASVLRQEGIEEAEVLLIDVGTPDHPPLAGCEHPAVRPVRTGGLAPYGDLRAEAVRRARGKAVVFIEEHCLAGNGWLRALVGAVDRGPWDGVGPKVVGGNPGIGFSDAMGIINYGDWTGRQLPREADMLPGNNSAYRREALLDLDPDLSFLLLSDTVLQWRLMEAGGRLFVEPDAVVAHRYPVTLWSAAKGEYLYHVGFAGARVEAFGWPWALRLAYAGASPVIPWFRLADKLRGPDDPAARQVVRRNLLGVLILMYAAVLGQAVGALLGARAAQLRFTDYELNEPRPTRDEIVAG